MDNSNQNKNKMETDLSGHTRFKKELKPPFAKITNMQFSSWKDHRMPEMLWSVLAIGNLPRQEALGFFRHIAKFVEKNPECHDVTITGIGKLPPVKRVELITHMGTWPKSKETLLPLLLFPSLPGFNEWEQVLGKREATSGDAGKIADGVLKVLWHQSQEATDCRWAKVLCLVMGKKLNYTANMEDKLDEILEYPNYGDMRKVRPSIRASEMVSPTIGEKLDTSWADNFWSFCHNNTACLPEASVGDEEKRYDIQAWDKQRKFYLDETIRVRTSMIRHYLETAKTTAIDYRHEASFGLSFYVYYLFAETILNRTDFSVTGRLVLRSMVEAYITLAYLLKKDDPGLWETYRKYGNGQAKFVYLKLQELKDKPQSIDEKVMYEIANEDAWQEFTTINIGNWDTTTLREMSDFTNLKYIYDQYYTWSSGFNHANWAAVREVVYERCVNPLHRLHRHPQINFPKLPSIVADAQKILNLTFDLLEEAYPKFSDRVKAHKPDVEKSDKT